MSNTNDIRTIGGMSHWNNARISVENDVHDERNRQLDKWGIQCHGLETWLTILTEECGEMAQAILRCRFDLPDTLSRNEPKALELISKVRDEAIQIAAVASAIAQHCDKGEA